MLSKKKIIFGFLLVLLAAVGVALFSEKASEAPPNQKIVELSPNLNLAEPLSDKTPRFSSEGERLMIPQTKNWKEIGDDPDMQEDQNEIVISSENLVSSPLSNIGTAQADLIGATKLTPQVSLTPFPEATQALPADQAKPVATSNGLIGAGMRAKSKAPAVSALEDLADQEEEVEVEKQTWYAGQTRGYSSLYLMHPNARQTVEREIENLINSKLQSVLVAALVDGTFGLDYAYLKDVLQRLNAPERRTTLLLYLSNGPMMRTEGERERAPRSFEQLEPAEFREKIISDPTVRQEVATLAAEARDVLNYHTSLNPANQNIVIPMLEDNLDLTSYTAMRDLIKTTLGGSILYMRNPCQGCMEDEKSGSGASAGDPVELHNPEEFSQLIEGDAYNMDGYSLLHNGEQSAQGYTLTAAQAMLQEGTARGLRYIALWRAARQGLGAGERPHPDERIYEVPTVAQSEIEVTLLQTGLEPVELEVAAETPSY